MLDVVEALEGPIAPMECFHPDREGRVLCSHEVDADHACATKLLWTRVQGGVTKALAGTTLAELVEFGGHRRRPDRRSPRRSPDQLTRTHGDTWPDLEIRNLHVSAEDKEILKGLDLEVSRGEVHALMGPNGSGKSTLANTIMGHPALDVTDGEIVFNGDDITEADPEERSRAGLFLAFQYPVAIPGVTVAKYLRMALNAHREARGEPQISLKDFRRETEAAMELVDIPREFSSRYVNDGFSGGEKKRLEILQLAMLRPQIAVLDETDSGLDIDALRIVAEGVNTFTGPDMGVLIITHYQRILHLVKPDFVHVMFNGRIVKQGGPELVAELEDKGYGWIREEVEAGRDRIASQAAEPPQALTVAGLPDRAGPGVVPGARRVRSTAAPSPTSTPAPAPSACSPRSRRSTATSAATTRTSTAARTRSRPRRPPPTRAPGRPSPTTSAPPTAARSSSSATPPRRSTSSPTPGAPPTSAPATGSCSPRWSTTRTSSPGSCSPSAPAPRSTGCRSPTTACSTWTPTRSCSSASPKLVAVAHVSNVLGTENPLAEIWRASPTRPARWSSPTAPRRRRSSRSTSARSGVGLLRAHRPQALRADRDRRALGAPRPAARRCRRSWAAAR